MENSLSQKNSNDLSISGILKSLLPVLRSRYLYIGLAVLAVGVSLSFWSQIYLHNSMSRGVMFPTLSDMILDSVPVIDVALAYDLTCIFIYAIVIVYIIHRKQYSRIPLFLVLAGIFYALRAVFVVLTPMGNPPNFNGSDPLFNGFMKYELGVYPSGHVGNTFLLLLQVYDKKYRNLLYLCLLIVIAALILTHCHYSIDILSGFIFAYALKSFGYKHLKMFNIDETYQYGER